MEELVALAQPQAPQPEALLLDLRTYGSVPPALAALTRQHPATAVVIVARTLDNDFILSAMRAGAKECLLEPVTAADLEAAITRVTMKATPIQTMTQSFA